MIFFERLVDPMRRLFRKSEYQVAQEQDDAPPCNPWQANLENLAKQHGDLKEEKEKVLSAITNQFRTLLEQTKMEKLKSDLEEQKFNLSQGQGKKRPRTQDVTVTDAKAWWGQSVATWDPGDGKNVSHQLEVRHPRKAKWFD